MVEMTEADYLLIALDDPHSSTIGCHADLEAYLGRPVVPSAFGDVGDAVGLIRSVLPGWWWEAGMSARAGHASIGPDDSAPNAIDPDGDSVVAAFANGFDADLAPGDGMHRVCRALIHCLVQAVAAKREFEARPSLTT